MRVGGSAPGDEDPTVLRLATRASPLALEQARRVAQRLGSLGLRAELVVVEAEADRRLDVAIGDLAGRGVFVNEVEARVVRGEADVAVHSAKDLPSSPPSGGDPLVLAAVPERGDARDALVGSTLDEMAPGATVATGSARRLAQLASTRPDLCFAELRGNIARRLDKIPSGGAVVVAVVALERLGMLGSVAEILSTLRMLPQVAQGAIALRCRRDDQRTRGVCAALDDESAHRRVRAERAFLERLGGGCEAPVGAHATPVDGSAVLRLEGLVASGDGHVVLRHHDEGVDPEELGRRVADALLEEWGGRALLRR